MPIWKWFWVSVRQERGLKQGGTKTHERLFVKGEVRGNRERGRIRSMFVSPKETLRAGTEGEKRDQTVRMGPGALTHS